MRCTNERGMPDLDDGGSYKGGGHDTICANGAYNDDILFSTGGVLCSCARKG